MIYFVKGFAKSPKVQKCTKSVCFPKIAAFLDLLIESVGSHMNVFAKSMLKFIEDVMLVRVFGYVGSNNMPHHFT